MNKLFKGLLVSAVVASSIFAANDVNLKIEVPQPAIKWTQTLETGFKVVKFPARVSLGKLPADMSFRIINMWPINGKKYIATVKDGELVTLTDKLGEATTEITTNDMFAKKDGKLVLMGNHPYAIASDSDSVAVNFLFATAGSGEGFLPSKDDDKDGILNGDDYCPYTAGVAGVVLDNTAANRTARAEGTADLVEVDGGTGIPAIGGYTGTAKVIGEDIVLTWTSAIVKVWYGSDISAVTTEGVADGMTATVPATATFMKIMDDTYTQKTLQISNVVAGGATATADNSTDTDTSADTTTIDTTPENTATTTDEEVTATTTEESTPTIEVIAPDMSATNLHGCPVIPNLSTGKCDTTTDDDSASEDTGATENDTTTDSGSNTASLLEVDAQGIPAIGGKVLTATVEDGNIILTYTSDLTVVKYGDDTSVSENGEVIDSKGVKVPATAKFIKLIDTDFNQVLLQVTLGEAEDTATEDTETTEDDTTTTDDTATSNEKKLLEVDSQGIPVIGGKSMSAIVDGENYLITYETDIADVKYGDTTDVPEKGTFDGKTVTISATASFVKITDTDFNSNLFQIQ